MEHIFTQNLFYAARAYLASKRDDCSLPQSLMARDYLHIDANLYSKWERGNSSVPAVAMTAMKILIKTAEAGINLEKIRLKPFFDFCKKQGISVTKKSFGQEHFSLVRSYLAFISPEAKANQDDLAKMLGVAPNLYSKWERGGETGNTAPAVAVTAMMLILKLSIAKIDYEQLSMDEFFEFAEDMPETKVKMF